MEFGVQVHEGGSVARLGSLHHLAVQFPKLANIGWLHIGGSDPSGEPFQGSNNRIDFTEIHLGDLRYYGPFSWVQGDQSLVLQSHQRLPDRSPADAEMVPKIDFVQFLTRLESSPGDRLLEELIHLNPQRLPLKPLLFEF